MGIIHAGQVYTHHSVHMRDSESKREREREQTSITDRLKVAIYLLHIYYSYYSDADVLWLLMNTVVYYAVQYAFRTSTVLPEFLIQEK